MTATRPLTLNRLHACTPVVMLMSITKHVWLSSETTPQGQVSGLDINSKQTLQTTLRARVPVHIFAEVHSCSRRADSTPCSLIFSELRFASFPSFSSSEGHVIRYPFEFGRGLCRGDIGPRKRLALASPWSQEPQGPQAGQFQPSPAELYPRSRKLESQIETRPLN